MGRTPLFVLVAARLPGRFSPNVRIVSQSVKHKISIDTSRPAGIGFEEQELGEIAQCGRIKGRAPVQRPQISLPLCHGRMSPVRGSAESHGMQMPSLKMSGARMGLPDDPESVVDDKCRVYGVEGLRVAERAVARQSNRAQA